MLFAVNAHGGHGALDDGAQRQLALPLVGQLGDVLGVVLGAGSAAAIAAARAYVKDRYPSIALP